MTSSATGNGLIDIGRLADLPLDSLVPYMQINVFSTIYMIQAALPYLRSNDGSQRGRVVVTSSGASTGEFAGLGLYSMSRAAQNCLVRTLAAEEKEKGVLAFAVMPGMIDVSIIVLCRWYIDNIDGRKLSGKDVIV